MKSSCSQFNVPNNSDDEIAAIQDGIKTAAAASKIDNRYILAVIMQESGGCVRVPTTNYGVRNPGLMQDHDGKATCNEGGVKTPCPKDTIVGMITDGTGTTNQGGLMQLLAQVKLSDASQYYKAARMYNSGSIDPSGNLGKGIATHCYATDVANRLLGWAGNGSGCQEGTIGNIGGTPGGNPKPSGTPKPTPTSGPVATASSIPSSKPTSTGSPKPTGTGSPKPTGTDSPKPTGTGHPKPTSTDSPSTPGGDSTPSGPKIPGANGNCKKWYTVKQGEDCNDVEKAVGIPFSNLQRFNTGLDVRCDNLWAGYSYCVSA